MREHFVNNEHNGNPLFEVICKSRDLQVAAAEAGWGVDKVFMKLMEECGEFSESILIENGDVAKHQAYEEPIYEAADVIICIVDVLARTYSGKKSRAELCTALSHALEVKGKKWVDKVVDKES